MEATVFINLATCAARDAITGIQQPKVAAKLQAHFGLTVKFFADTGEAAALLDSPTFRVALKATPTGSPFVLTNTVSEELDDGYYFEIASVDAAALRTAIGDLKQLDAWLEVEWTLAGTVERAATPATILNAYIRSADAAPDPVEEASETWLSDRAVRYDEEQTLTATEKAQALENIGVTITVGGYLRLTNAAGDVFHASLNSGEPPS